jgi:hypothetical protein
MFDEDERTFTALVDDTYVDASISAGEVKWYRFTAAANKPYEVSWDDSGDGAGKIADIKVSAYYAWDYGSDVDLNTNTLFRLEDSGYTTPKGITSSTQARQITLRVDGSTTGTFAIKFKEQ